MSLSNTKLSKLLGISTPIISAPMGGVAGGLLAGQVTLGGGFGFIGAAGDSAEKIQSELDIARKILATDRNSPLRIGVGFLGWLLEKDESQAEEAITTVLDNHVMAIWLAFGNNLQKWIQFIRAHDSAHGKKTIIFIQLSSVESAHRAIHDWKIDVLVAQGIESGGHGDGSAPPLISLIPPILSIVPPDGPVVVGAGGIVTGGQVAALLTLGVSGVVLGTRFLMTPESRYNDAQKRALAAAGSTATVRTMAFDEARNTMGWPEGIDGRGLRNAIVDDYEAGVDVETLRSKSKDALGNNDTNRMVIWAGTSVGQLKTIKPAKEVVEELHQECLAHLTNISAEILSP